MDTTIITVLGCIYHWVRQVNAHEKQTGVRARLDIDEDDLEFTLRDEKYNTLERLVCKHLYEGFSERVAQVCGEVLNDKGIAVDPYDEEEEVEA